MKYKVNVVLVVLMLGALVLSSCAPASPAAPAAPTAPAQSDAAAATTAPAPTAAPSGEVVTLKWVYPGWDSKGQEAAVTKIIADFEASHPNIKIELQNIPWANYHDKLIISLQSGDGPDGGYVIARWLPELQGMGKLVDLSEFRKQLDQSDWFESAWAEGTFDGKTYSIPDRREPYVFFYNKALFKEAGLDQFPSTMDEFLAAAQKLTTGGRYGVGLVGAQDATLPAYYLNFLYAFNGSVLGDDGSITITDKTNVEAMQYYVDLVNKYKVTQPSVLADARDQVRKLFMAGQVAMMVDGLYAVGTFKDLAPNLDYGIGMIPQVEGRERRALTTGWDNVIFTGTKHQKEAEEFIKFYTQPENMAAGVVTLPARKSAFETPRFQDASYAPWKEALTYGYPNPKTKFYEQTMTYVGEALQNALSGKMTVEQALQNAETQIKALGQ